VTGRIEETGSEGRQSPRLNFIIMDSWCTENGLSFVVVNPTHNTTQGLRRQRGLASHGIANVFIAGTAP